MDYVVCSQCGANFPRFEEVKEKGRLINKDWATAPAPTCPPCRGLAAPAIPKRNVLGGYPPGRHGAAQGAKQ
ncbi:MAG: hypothetical protein M0R06_16875 [Sphaerochaeta sp.]|jgi:hypothetical protein|nr:hypothetical protein [Sphaerochaeta sp.]